MGIRDDLYDRLAGLASALGLLPGERLASFLDRFGPYLSHYMEYGALYELPSVTALSVGQGAAFHDTLAQWLMDEGFSEEDQARVGRLRSSVDDWMVVKVDVVGPAVPRAGVYLRRPVAMGAIDPVLLESGATPAGCAAVHRVARALDVGCAQIVALGLGDSPDTKVYLGMCHGDPAPERIEEAFALLGVPFDGARRFLAALPHVRAVSGSLLLSMFLREDGAAPVAKLDVFGVALHDLDGACAAGGVTLGGLPSPSALGERVGLRTAEHAGVLFRDVAAPALSLYFPFDR